MDWHDHVTRELIESQLAERRAAAATARMARAQRAPRRTLRIALGAVLIRLGSRLAGPLPVAVHHSGH